MTRKKTPKVRHIKGGQNFDIRLTMAKQGILDKGITGKLATQEQNILNAYVFTKVGQAFEFAYKAGMFQSDKDAELSDEAKKDMQDKFTLFIKMKPKPNE